MNRRLLLAAAACVLTVSACVIWNVPPGAPKGTYEERIETFARLLQMEDARDYNPLLTGRAASSPDPWLRAKTALAVGRLHDRDSTIYLPVFLRDEDRGVRRSAAFACGISGDARLVRFLARALKDDDDPEVQASAAEALSRLGGKEATTALVEAASGAGERAGAGARALWRFPSAANALVLAPLASSPSLELRRSAIYALSRKPVPEAAGALRSALLLDDPQSVAWAARALGLLDDEASVESLVGLAWSREPSVAVQAMTALEKIGEKHALPAGAMKVALLRAADHVPGIAISALRLLGRFAANDEVRSALDAAVAEGGWRGQTALSSLAADPARARPALLRALKSPSVTVRLGVVDALRRLPMPEALDLAARVASDPSPRVRAGAAAWASSLAADRRSEAKPLLLAALADRDAAVRSEALSAAAPLVSTGEPALSASWEKAYDAALSEKEPDYLVSALDAAASLATGARERVAVRVDDANPVLREKARRVLVEKFGVLRGSFRAFPVPVRYDLNGYRRLARLANETLVSATVETQRGSFEIALSAETAPLTVANFAELAKKGFFDHTVIHRVVPDFVVQAGDPRGDGTGGPGWAIRDELVPDRYERGTVGMALSGPDTGGSQWFVALSPQPHLDGAYTVFGHVTTFLEVLDRTEQDDALVSVTVEETPRPAPPWGAAR